MDAITTLGDLQAAQSPFWQIANLLILLACLAVIVGGAFALLYHLIDSVRKGS